MLDRLDAKLRERLLTAYAPRSTGPLGTAVRSFALFALSVPSRELFRRPRFAGDTEAEAHNEWTLCLWALWLEMFTSAKTKQRLKASTIEQRISLAKGLFSHRYGFCLAGSAPRLGSLIKSIREGDPKAGERKKRRAMRRRHLNRAWERYPQLRAASFTQLNKWAALTTARVILTRGGELSNILRSDLTFHAKKNGKRYLIIRVRPLKKRGGAAQPKVPQLIGEFTTDASACAYTAIRRLVESETWSPETPLFRTKPDKAMSTGAFRSTVREVAKLLGFNPKEFGAQSCRIGGATDLAGTGRASQLLLQAKGRWASDIGAIYARMTRKQQLAVSDLMYECKSKDLEEILPEFTQPA
jgi:hypothetical protein